jgi:hypothetical protein
LFTLPDKIGLLVLGLTLQAAKVENQGGGLAHLVGKNMLQLHQHLLALEKIVQIKNLAAMKVLVQL